MIELATKAENYAAEKTNEMMVRAIAQAYADGYRDGYKDREEEIPVDLRDNKTEYVDLGLPSGTLWSNDYEMIDNENYKYEPYLKTSKLQIPTKEQWEELLNMCRWEYEYLGQSSRRHDCIGPNGNVISFYSKGYSKTGEELYNPEKVFFWIKGHEEDSNMEQYVAYMSYSDGAIHKTLEKFSGYKFLLRLVQK